MKSIARHSIVFGRVLALVFLFVYSRFETILHMCGREASECCYTASGARDHNGCPDKALPVAGISIYNVNGCRSSVVVRSLRVVLALVEKDSKVQNVKVLSLFTFPSVLHAPSKTSSWFNYCYFGSVSLHSAEKYVLNATFLI